MLDQGEPTGELDATASTLAATPPSAAREDDSPVLVSVADFEAAARQRMSHATWEYFSSGVADELTLRWNQKPGATAPAAMTTAIGA
jgi:hypothetical protein